jgi:hypothetical protein
MREQYLYPHEMFDVSANGLYCGVFVPTDVMKKLMKINAKWVLEIQQLFNEHKNELLVSNWTGYFPKDESGKVTGSTCVQYSDPNDWTSVEERIALFKPRQPTHVDVYICDRGTGVLIAEEIHKEMQEATK